MNSIKKAEKAAALLLGLPIHPSRRDLRKPFQKWPRWALRILAVISTPFQLAIYGVTRTPYGWEGTYNDFNRLWRVNPEVWDHTTNDLDI